MEMELNRSIFFLSPASLNKWASVGRSWKMIVEGSGGASCCDLCLLPLKTQTTRNHDGRSLRISFQISPPLS